MQDTSLNVNQVLYELKLKMMSSLVNFGGQSLKESLGIGRERLGAFNG